MCVNTSPAGGGGYPLRVQSHEGLVHLRMGHELTSQVDLAPVGLCSGDALPRNEMEARDMIHGLLHGLAALHKVGAAGWGTWSSAGHLR